MSNSETETLVVGRDEAKALLEAHWRLRQDRDRMREALVLCHEAFSTINASNGATRRAEAAIRAALDE